MMSYYAEAFSSIANPECILLILVGVVLGIVFGSMPGISASMGIALILPITYSMGMQAALSILIGLYVGGVSGGLIAAILLNIPGTPGSIATTFDGYPMARRGEAGKALGVGMLYSFFGGMISLIILVIAAPLLAKVALKFSPVDYFGITLLSFALIASLSGASLLKGMLSTMLGVLFTTIGTSFDGTLRYTFGNKQLMAGIDLLPVMIAVYAITEVLAIAERDKKIASVNEYKLKGFGVTFKEFLQQIPNMLRSALIGTGVGILPGIGANLSNILSYTAAKNSSKNPEKFGTGCVDGIIASETSNNAVTGGAMIPLLCLGIPGDACTALLLAALTLHGVQAGPLLFTNKASLVYSMFIIMLIANVFMLVSMYYGMRGYLQMLKIPKHILMAIILVVCTIGAFSVNNRVFDIWTILVVSILAYAMQRAELPLAPFILGFVLGDLFETNLLRGLMFTGGSFFKMFTYPIAAVCIVGFVAVVIWTAYSRMKKKGTEG